MWTIILDGESLPRFFWPRSRTSRASDSGAAWSPDGHRLAFNSDQGGNVDIYVVGADGTGLTRLTG